jgi:hypothetical protein
VNLKVTEIQNIIDRRQRKVYSSQGERISIRLFSAECDKSRTVFHLPVERVRGESFVTVFALKLVHSLHIPEHPPLPEEDDMTTVMITDPLHV